jgi:hypothetical protein
MLVHRHRTGASTEPGAELQNAGVGKLLDQLFVTRIGAR